MRTTTMKTKLKGRKSIAALFAIAAVFFLSCDNPISLGVKLDLEGPTVEFTAPVPRKSVPVGFTVEGTATDKSVIEQLILTAELNREPFVKQWRYYRGNWEVSEDSGASWTALEGAVWDGSPQSAAWSIPVDMTINGELPEDGEYLFMVQAWDSAGFTDDNSFKTIVLIVDLLPPSVQVIDPYLYSRWSYSSSPAPNGAFNNEKLEALHNIANNDESQSRNAANIGSFLTRGFDMKWLIDDQHDIWSIDILLYEYNKAIDNAPETPVPTDYIYRYHENLGPPPATPDPANNINPNGSVTIPALNGAAGIYEGAHKGGELKAPISTKTTIRVVAVCYDAAGNPNEERTLGYFIYWPKADEPWIAYPTGMDNPHTKNYFNTAISTFENDVLMIYPSRSIKATVFQAHRVGKVNYTLSKCVETGGANNQLNGNLDVVAVKQDLNPETSTRFAWEFFPPPQSGYYVVTATVDDGAEEFTALFRVQDVSFPRFLTSPSPNASDPLYEHINIDNDTITISGSVDDAKEVASVLMVWINPSSRNFSAMSQLSYFRDPTYQGWEQAKLLAPGGTGVETGPGNPYPYDPLKPNKFWNLKLTEKGENNEYRQEYDYAQVIKLEDDLRITIKDLGTDGEGKPIANPLRSQMFLLKVENTSGKSTIITYAPQGDETVPTITINRVEVRQTRTTTTPNTITTTVTPGAYAQIPQFADNDVVTIYGNWTENSATHLNVANYLYDSLQFIINTTEITRQNLAGATLTLTPTTGTTTAGAGTFTLAATVGPGHTLPTGSMKDTLVVSAAIKDFGGNPAETGATWLIESDKLRFLRVSAEEEEGRTSSSYHAGETIRIFLEFSKPVMLKNRATADTKPVLFVNSRTAGNGVAIQYEAGQDTENTKQYFTYTVQPGDNTPSGSYLDVTGISVNSGTGQGDTNWNNATALYPFTWVYTKQESNVTTTEEIRVTRQTSHSLDTPVVGYGALPTGAANSRSLIAGKNIVVDTTAPTVTGVTANPTGWLTTGAAIQIEVKFSERVKIGEGANAPYLILATGNSGTQNTDPKFRATSPRLNNDSITFTYTVIAGDNAITTNGVTIAGFGGTITDIAGNALASSPNPFASHSLTTVNLDTTAPTVPTVTIRSNNANVTVTPIMYHDALSIQIAGATGDQNLARYVYSTNTTNGADGTWITNASTAGTISIPLSTNGTYRIAAKQIDRAGNESPVSAITTFEWDQGNLVSSITSVTPNGDYTWNDDRKDSINITVNFRKALRFNSNQTITLNVRNGTTVTTTNHTEPINSGANAVRSITFTYPLKNGDNTNGARLSVTGMTLNATDGTDAVPTAFMTPPAGNTLQNNNIYLVTGALTIQTQPALSAGAMNPDGSYSATLTVVFARQVQKKTGSIVLTQQRTNYRLPAVLTAAQRDKIRNAMGSTWFTAFDGYYTRGTNGYDTTANASDTSTKYILTYTIDPSAAANQPDNNNTTAIKQFAEAFRLAERVTIPVNSAAVIITNNTTTNRGTLTVSLSIENGYALQVPGATYDLTMPAGLVQDMLSYPSPAPTTASLNATNGTSIIAKPVIRVRRAQDTVVTRTGSVTQSRIRADQPLTTDARIDCRTPGTIIYYITAETASATVTDVNWLFENTTPADATNPAAPGRPADPRTTTNGRQQYTNGNTISIGGTTGGNATSLTNVQGLQWRIRAKATTLTGNNPAQTETSWGADADEMAYRSVLTYRVRDMTGTNNPGQSFEQNKAAGGNQVWVRGGDAIGSSNIPGFPLTWEDDWASLTAEKRRAGIRVLDLVTQSGTNLSANSTWRWVTWEINAPMFFDFIMGNDDDSSAAVATQYGPRQYVYQRAGWTSYKENYRLYPGKHRWMYVDGNGARAPTNNGSGDTQGNTGKGNVNFAMPYIIRPEFTTATYP